MRHRVSAEILDVLGRDHMGQHQVQRKPAQQSKQERAAAPTPISHRNQVERARRAAARRVRTGTENGR